MNNGKIDVYAFDERAGIFEFEAGIERHEAQRKALLECLGGILEQETEREWLYFAGKYSGLPIVEVYTVSKDARFHRTDTFQLNGLEYVHLATEIKNLAAP